MKKRVIASVAFVAAAVLLVALLWLVIAAPYRLYIVHTGSMDPSIPSGSAVFVRTEQYETGQVVTFVVNGETVTHRLMAVASDGAITTKGDGNATVDPWHPPASSIIGGVIAAPRNVGFVLYFLFRTTGGLAVVALLAAIWLLWNSDRPTASTEVKGDESVDVPAETV